MAGVSWSDQALGKIDEIVGYIAQDNPTAGVEMGRALLEAGESLRLFPNRGRPAPGGRRELLTIRPYIIIYKVIDDTVTILGIRHGAQRSRRGL